MNYEKFCKLSKLQRKNFLSKGGFYFKRQGLVYDISNNTVQLQEINPFTQKPAVAKVMGSKETKEKCISTRHGETWIQGVLQINMDARSPSDILVFVAKDKAVVHPTYKQRERMKEIVKRGAVVKMLDDLDDKEKKITFSDHVCVNTVEHINYCISQEHKIEEIQAIINILSPEGHIIKRTIHASYCTHCKKYYLEHWEYEAVCNLGVPLCQIISHKHMEKHTGLYSNINEESILHRAGYNVDSYKDLTEAQRHGILVCLMESGTPKSKISSHLTWLINQRKNIKNMREAVSKWEADRLFVSKYRLGDHREVFVDVINTKK